MLCGAWVDFIQLDVSYRKSKKTERANHNTIPLRGNEGRGAV